MPNSSGSSKSSPVLYHNFFETVSSRFKGAKTDTGESVSNFSKKVLCRSAQTSGKPTS